jgi:DNA-binding winged helix-turn-helix (wHTH) protein/Tfp pilus assembly protein PilF
MRYQVGPFQLDDERCEIRESDRVVHVEPRVQDLLFYLLRHRDRVVPREELFDAVWKTRFVGEAALSRCVMQARKALARADAEVIKTVHRRGYRFVAPVAEADEPVAVSGRDPAAEKLYARAMQLAKKRTPETIRSAIALLQEALELEPDYAAAYAALGDCYLFIGFLQQTAPKSVYPKALAALDRATELDPSLAGAHAARGFIESIYGWNPIAASDALNVAIELDPKLAIAHHRLGLHLLTQRRIDDAESALRHAAALDPLSPIYATACGLPAMGRGEPERAAEVYRGVIESEPSFYPVHFYLGLALEQSGDRVAAIQAFRFAVSVAESETEAMPALAHALARSGEREEAGRIAEHLQSVARQRFISPFFFAVIAMGLGDREAALEALAEAVTIRATRMSELHLDPRFRPLHDDKRFQDLLATIGTDPQQHARAPKWWSRSG